LESEVKKIKEIWQIGKEKYRSNSQLRFLVLSIPASFNTIEGRLCEEETENKQN
jgi:hypothetical protein